MVCFHKFFVNQEKQVDLKICEGSLRVCKWPVAERTTSGVCSDVSDTRSNQTMTKCRGQPFSRLLSQILIMFNTSVWKRLVGRHNPCWASFSNMFYNLTPFLPADFSLSPLSATMSYWKDSIFSAWMLQPARTNSLWYQAASNRPDRASAGSLGSQHTSQTATFSLASHTRLTHSVQGVLDVGSQSQTIKMISLWCSLYKITWNYTLQQTLKNEKEHWSCKGLHYRYTYSWDNW